MSEMEIWISDAATSLGLRVERLADEDALITTEAIQLRFVDDSPGLVVGAQETICLL
jgi:hypothetical protein